MCSISVVKCLKGERSRIASKSPQCIKREKFQYQESKERAGESLGGGCLGKLPGESETGTFFAPDRDDSVKIADEHVFEKAHRALRVLLLEEAHRFRAHRFMLFVGAGGVRRHIGLGIARSDKAIAQQIVLTSSIGVILISASSS